MLRPIHLCLLTALGFLAAVAAARADDFAASVVRIRAVASDGTTKFGSGVVIEPGRIATACHVTRSSRTIEILLGEKRWIAQSASGSPLHDLCVLHVPDVDVPAARIRGTQELRPGERVIAAGFQGGGAELVVGRGAVAALYAYDDGLVIRTTAAFDFGSSGGGLFDEAGNLVGLLAFKARAGDNLRFALPTEWLSPASVVAAAFTPIDAASMTSAFWERTQGERPAFLGVAMREAASPRQ